MFGQLDVAALEAREVKGEGGGMAHVRNLRAGRDGEHAGQRGEKNPAGRHDASPDRLGCGAG